MPVTRSPSTTGALTLSQNATGGAGGSSSGLGGSAGAGGAATTALTFDDTNMGNSLSGYLTAAGGAGGTGNVGAGGASGGAASATLSLIGAAVGDAVVDANGGAGGLANAGGALGHGGNASAVVSATSSSGGEVNAASDAKGGAGVASAGTATARTTTVGAGGGYSAQATTSLVTGSLIQSVSATASGTVSGTSVALTSASILGAMPAFSSTSQAVAYESGAPSTASTNAVLAANGAIKTAFGASPAFFAVGELGGGYSVSGTGPQVVNSTITEAIDLTKLKARGNLVIGFYDGDAVGTGVTKVTVTVLADGATVYQNTFTSGAAAEAFFTDDAVSLGSLASGSLSGNALSLKVTMQVTTDAANAGFYGDVILGDPPGARTALRPNMPPIEQQFPVAASGGVSGHCTQAMIQAMSSFVPSLLSLGAESHQPFASQAPPSPLLLTASQTGTVLRSV